MKIDPIKVAEASEKLGIVGVLVLLLCLFLPAAIWGIRFLYREKSLAEKLRAEQAEECANDRLKAVEAIGDLKVEVAKLDTRLEVQNEDIRQQKEEFRDMHLAALERVAGIDNRPS